MNSLSEKYRPRTLTDIRGQGQIVQSLASFVRRPTSRAFIFSGSPGTGKTSAAYALAVELGVDVDKREWGGLHEIASGELTADAVREIFRTTMNYHPWHGSGWKLLLCNEADNMSDKAAFIFLDTLEHLPAKVVVVFTTNEFGKLPRRLRERCECYQFKANVRAFNSEATEAEQAAQSLIDDVWIKELGHNHAPRLADLQGWHDEGQVSFRAVLNAIEPMIRAEMAEQVPGVRCQVSGDGAGLQGNLTQSKRVCIRVELPAKAERSAADIMAAAAERAMAFQQALAGA